MKFRIIANGSESYILDEEKDFVVAVVKDPAGCKRMVALANRIHAKDGPVDEALLVSRIDEVFEFSVRVMNAIDNEYLAKTRTGHQQLILVGELVQQTEKDLLKRKNFGRRCLFEVQNLLAGKGLTLGMKIDDWGQMLERREVAP